MSISHDTLVYNALDSAITMQVARAFWKEVEAGGYQEQYDFVIKLLQPLMYMESRGIAVDKDALEIVKVRTNQEICDKKEKLNELCGREINAGSPQQVANYFYIEKNITPYTTLNAKKVKVPTTNDKALARIAKGTSSRRPYPEAKVMQEIRGLVKLMGTYLDMEFDPDNRFRCSVNPRGTRTGRISTGKTIRDTGMNMQNLPPVFKHFLVPDPGYVMFEIDKRQAEWVVVAYDSGDANMISVIENGGDPHVHTAHLAFGVPEDLIIADNKLIGHSTDPVEIKQLRQEHMPELFELEHAFIPRIFSMRQGGKKSNHGLNYDEGFKRFALENELTEKESKVIVELYHQIYPGIRLNYEAVKTKLREDRTLTNCFGFTRKFQERWGDDLFKAAYAYIPQSTVGYLVNMAILDMYDDPDPCVEVFELLGQVHDSILIQVPMNIPLDRMARGLHKIREHLDPELSLGGRDFHIETDMKGSLKSWGDMDDIDISGDSLDIAAALEKFFVAAKAKGLVDRVP